MTIRRLKTYAGSQGYVYQYYFVGRRSAAAELDLGSARDTDSDEYIFDVTSNRESTYAVSVFLPRQVVAAWGESHGRPLSYSEQYAAVKMRLFRAFDECPSGEMQTKAQKLAVDLQQLEESLAALGVD
jgi:hypothetical protein